MKTRTSLDTFVSLHHRRLVPALFFAFATAALGNAIVCPADAPSNVRLAAQEVRRYVWLRTGELLPVADKGGRIALKADPALAPQQYRLESDGGSLTISGGSDVAVLYGAYAFAEKLGVRFYLDGDIVPDTRIPFAIPPLDETRAPLFDLRGIQPFHDFPEGPDWWNRDDYLAYVSQLAKLRMNFIGLHCYPEGGVGPEPLVWIGLTNDLAVDGRVEFAYPSFWANTPKGTWGYAPMPTGDFAGGAARLFPADEFGPDAMAGLMPRPASPEQCRELFDRVGRQMGDVFGAARQLGIQTCIGTETPLQIPAALRERLTHLGMDPKDTNTIRALYTGMFRRITQVSPVDYYWLWTPEDWTWGDNKPGQFEATLRDIRLALGALDDLHTPFILATSGWVLGPAHDRAALDAFLPKSSPMSCINRQVGHDGVEPAFANILGRPKWAIPWMENDPNMVGPQPWVARMRHDAVDARRFGCTGLFGIHWRTKALAPNVAALAAAAWDQSWVPASYDSRPARPARSTEGARGGDVGHFTAPVADSKADRASGGTPKPSPRDRAMPIEDFYLDFARASFGEPVAEAAGRLMAEMDGVRMPQASDWKNGPGNLVPNPKPWSQEKARYAFVDEFAALRPRVKGLGNLDRFDYWLDTWRGAAVMAEACCARGQLDQAMAAKDYEAALAVRLELARLWAQLLSIQAGLVRTPGELGTIANLEQHTRKESRFVEAHDDALAKALGRPLPAEAAPSQRYAGPPRLIVPTVRTTVRAGEALSLKVIVLDNEAPRRVQVLHRPLGRGAWQELPAQPAGRGVHSVALPVAHEDFEYYVTAESALGSRLVWPATAPDINQTVVSIPH